MQCPVERLSGPDGGALVITGDVSLHYLLKALGDGCSILEAANNDPRIEKLYSDVLRWLANSVQNRRVIDRLLPPDH